MANKKLDPKISLLLEIMDQAFDTKAWHGTTLKGSIRGLKMDDVLWRPAPRRHNIWELVLHCAYWKYCIRKRILGDKSLSFARKGSDWIDLPQEKNETLWKNDVKLLVEEHTLLYEAIKNMPASKLNRVPTGSKIKNIATLYGISSHDLYHAGQIQLIKRLHYE